MAIFSLQHSSIGKKTHAAGTAGAHIRYISRQGAEPEIIARSLSSDPARAIEQMNKHEAESRANARLCEKIMIALPIELGDDQRAVLVRDFAEELSQGKIPFFAALHQRGDDQQNPHAHMVFIDRDENGQRVLKLSDSPRDREKAGLEPNGTEWVRQQWETMCNAYLKELGIDAKIDRRSLEAQGIDREAQIHIGPKAQHIEDKGQEIASSIKEVANSVFAKEKTRSVDYEQIDQGRTRSQYNAEIIEFNIEKLKRSADPMERQKGAMMERHRHEWSVAKELNEENRTRIAEATKNKSELWKGYQEKRGAIKEQREADKLDLKERLKEQHKPEWAELFSKQREENKDLETLVGNAKELYRQYKDAVKIEGIENFGGVLSRTFNVFKYEEQQRERHERERLELAKQHKKENAPHYKAIEQRAQQELNVSKMDWQLRRDAETAAAQEAKEAIEQRRLELRMQQQREKEELQQAVRERYLAQEREQRQQEQQRERDAEAERSAQAAFNAAAAANNNNPGHGQGLALERSSVQAFNAVNQDYKPN